MPRLRPLLAPVSLALALCCAAGVAENGWGERATAQRRASSRSSMRAGPQARAPAMGARRGRAATMRTARRRATRRRAPAPRVSAAYRRQVVRWHRRPTPESVAHWEQQNPPTLVFRPVRYPGDYVLVPDESGAFSSYQLRAARKAFTYRDALSHDVHPALIERAYRIVREFRVPYLWLISGYRDTRSTSRHSQGRAMDIVAPGVSNAQLARFARSFGFTGVGEYPQSGFVHVDVRARSYFWVDRSAPGARSRERQVRRGEAQRADQAARQRGEAPIAEGAEQAPGEGEEQGDASGAGDVAAGEGRDAGGAAVSGAQALEAPTPP